MKIKTNLGTFEFDLNSMCSISPVKVTKTDGKVFYIDFDSICKIYKIVNLHQKKKEIDEEIKKYENTK